MTEQEAGWWASWLSGDDSCEPRDACISGEPCWTHSDWDDGPCVCHALDGRYCRVHGRTNDDEPEDHDLGGEG